MLKCFVQDLVSKMPVVCVFACVCLRKEDVIWLILNTDDLAFVNIVVMETICVLG